MVTGALLMASGVPAVSAAAQATPAGRTPAVGPDADTPRPKLAVIAKRLDVRAGAQARVRGRLLHAERRTRVTLQARRGPRWVALDHARTAPDGRFVLRERVRGPVSALVRVRAAGARARRLGRLNAYRVTYASWYGPGFYGQRTGCGGTLAAGQVGVAHKTLPCGSRVTFRHRGRVVRVPVIDRGPYVGGREFDLTAATAAKLRFSGHGALLAAH